MQEQEGQRQKKLREELERQKRLYEEDRLLQRQKQETMKAQERERLKQEERRRKIEKEQEEQQKTYRFHKVQGVGNPHGRPSASGAAHQPPLSAPREMIRKQLEDGVEAMYQEAVRLYNQGQYPAAAEKFKDVEDIIPGYKRAGQYMA